ncbi:IMCp domain-containing protein [Caulobacter sp. ErkDOM-E]|uniref:IMCp domain-containing protein n=1 Tax=Caulobacter sp. ErkDOM-E TaxID=3402778 RepID=UPI003AF4E18E
MKTPFRTLLLAGSIVAATSLAAPALADGYPAALQKAPAKRPKPVTRVVYVDRVVEKPVYIDRPVDRVVEKIVERRVEVPVVKVVEKIVEKPVYVDRPVDRVVEKIVKVPVERIVEKPVYIDRVVERPVQVARDCDCGPRHERRREDHRASGGVIISDETYESESARYEESQESRSWDGAAYYGGNQNFSTRYGLGGGWLPQPVDIAPDHPVEPPYIGGGYVGRPSGGRGGGYYGGVVGGSGGGWAGGSARSSASATASASSSVRVTVGGGGSGCGGCGGKRY